jgi:hypothetical protein
VAAPQSAPRAEKAAAHASGWLSPAAVTSLRSAWPSRAAATSWRQQWRARAVAAAHLTLGSRAPRPGRLRNVDAAAVAGKPAVRARRLCRRWGGSAYGGEGE